MSGASLFALPPGADFAREFAHGYHDRFSDAPFDQRARALVLVNTVRAARDIAVALADHAPRAGPLPRIRVIPDLADDPDFGAGVADSVSAIRRQLHLTRLVEQYLASAGGAGATVAPTNAAPDLAESLAVLIDQFHDHGAEFIGLRALRIAGEAARHWQHSLEFLEIVLTGWPAILAEAEGGKLDPRDRLRRLVDQMIETWKNRPPDYPVIAAGSTGSVGTTARLMAAVSSLPTGAIVLPGFDPATDPAIWDAATADHPLGPFRALFELLGAAPRDAELWTRDIDRPRRELLAQAMRPAPVTDHWHQARDHLCRIAAPALNGLSLIEAEGPRHEAAAIAVAIREVLADPDAEVALVTPDGALARRVTAALGRFGIIPDDTMGAPLAQTVPGTLVTLVLTAAGPACGALDIAALLQHPLLCPGVPRETHRDLARGYELRVLRGTGARFPGLPADPTADADAVTWLATIENALSPVSEALRSNSDLGDQVAALSTALEQLTDPTDEAGPRIWNGEEGTALRWFLIQLARHADAAGNRPVSDFADLLAGLMRGEQVRPRPREHHRRVRIIGTREARIEGADRIILSGLNEGTWPAPADPGPWLSRPMHEALGLPLPERSVGLAAHDFLQAACRPEVVLTRSLRADGAPTVASRWLVRLETLLTGIGADRDWKAVRSRGERYVQIAARLDRADTELPRAERPRPVPPRAAIPRLLSATQIETLIRDAYAVYARQVLRLKPMEPLDRAPDARERGEFLHALLERFVNATQSWPGPVAARAVLVDVADRVLAEQAMPADLRRAWRGRIGRFADWLVRAEDARRADASPLALESAGKLVLPVAGEDFTVTARADRIDRKFDGSGAVYDYKSGHPPGKGQIEKRFNQQLNLAAAILGQGGFDDAPAMTVTDGAYIGLTGGREGGREQPVPGIDAVPEYLEELSQLLTAYLSGAPWISRGRPELISFESDYDHLARRAEWSDEDEP